MELRPAFAKCLALITLLLAALAGCKTTAPTPPAHDAEYLSMSENRWESPSYGYTLQAKSEVAFFKETPSGSTALEQVSAVLFSPNSGVAAVAFPLPDQSVSIEAIATGFGRALNNGFAEVPGLRPIPREDIPFPACEHRFSPSGTTDNTIYYTTIQLPGRAVLVAQVVNGASHALHHANPADRFPVRFEAVRNLAMAPRITEGRRSAYAAFLNGMGLYYFESGHTRRAVDLFTLAHEHDSTQADFLFNLTLAHLNRGEAEDVVALLEHKLEAFPDDMRLLRFLAAAYAQEGRHQDAVHYYDQLIAEGVYNPGILSEYFDALAGFKTFDDLIEKARPFLKNNTAIAAMWIGIAHREKGDLDDAATAVAPFEAAMLREQEPGSFLIDLALRRGEFAGAIDYVDQIIALTDNREMEFFRGVAQMQLGHYAAARDAFEACLAVNPGNAEAHRLVAQMHNILGQTDPSLFRNEVKAVPLAPFLEHYQTRAEESYLAQTGALGEYVGHAIHWQVDQPRRLTRYESFRVRDADALARMKENILSFDPLFERIYVNRLDVYNADGKLVAQGDPARFFLSDPHEDSIANTRKNLHIPIPGLLVGGWYEMVVSREYLGPADTMYFHDYCFSGMHPRKLSFLQLSGDMDRIAVKVSDPLVEFHEDDKRRIWIHPQPPISEMHSMLPDYFDYLPMIWLADKETTSWEALAEYYATELEDVLGPVPAAIRDEAEALDTGAGTIAAKVKAVSDLISEKYAYTALNFGRHATLPHDAIDIFQNRFGDCKDLTVVMHHYLKALGVETFPALVRSSKGLVSELPSVDQFDHMVLYVPDLAPCPVVDPTDRFMSIGFIPRSVDHEPILVIQPEADGLLDLGGMATEDNRVVVDRKLGIDRAGVVDGREVITFAGLAAADLRGYLSRVSPEDYVQVIQELLARAGLSLPLQAVRIPNVPQANEPLHLELDYRLTRRFFTIGSEWIGQLPGSWDYSYFLRSRSDRPRRAPVEVQRPLRLETHTEITLPENWRLMGGDVVDGVLEKNAFGSFSRSVAESQGEDQEVFKTATYVEVPAAIYPADRYAEIADFFDFVSEGLTPQVRVGPR